MLSWSHQLECGPAVPAFQTSERSVAVGFKPSDSWCFDQTSTILS
jgi:hypothetical protein